MLHIDFVNSIGIGVRKMVTSDFEDFKPEAALRGSCDYLKMLKYLPRTCSESTVGRPSFQSATLFLFRLLDYRRLLKQFYLLNFCL